MTQETQEIEVEVVEIDGVEPILQADREIASDDPQQQRPWHGRITFPSNRWWPVWAILGVTGLTLLLTVGVAVGVVLLVSLLLKLLRSMFR